MKLLLALLLLNMTMILGPLLVALPPVRQTPGMLAAAHTAKALAPWLSVALTAFAAIRLRPDITVGKIAALLVAILFVVLSRINLMEYVFAGASGAATAAVGEFHDVQDSDMVLGVVVEGRSRAYPVRYMAYHHMLNDRLGATALLPTY